MSYLIAMQAAGLVTSYLGMQNQKGLIDMGRKLEQSQFETNLEALKLESIQASAYEIKAVRQNIGTQIAINAARGNRGGSSFAGINESLNSFNQDERIRQINLAAKTNALRGQNLLSDITADSKKRQLTYDFIKGSGNTLSPSSAGGAQGGMSDKFAAFWNGTK